jgi:hypothetical protein
MIQIHFPEQIDPEMSPPGIVLPGDELKCTSNFIVFVEKSMRCEWEKVPKMAGRKTVTIKMNFKSTYSVIKPYDRFSVKIRGVRNPISTKTTDSFSINIVDQQKREVNIKNTEITVTTGIPYPIPGTDAKITPKNPWPGVESEFEIEFVPKHEIEINGGILVVYPPQITPVPDNNVAKEVIVEIDG